MGIIKASDVREMSVEERQRALKELREELMMLRSMQTGGGLQDNPAKSKILKKQIARILTVMNESKEQ
ncbi:MAG: 50S ribosomal protein L29 [Promethearchaeia archaeon]